MSSIRPLTLARSCVCIGLALALAFAGPFSAHAESTVTVSLEGMRISNLVGSLLFEGGVIRFNQWDRKKITRWESEISIGTLSESSDETAVSELEAAVGESIQFIQRADEIRIVRATRPGDANVLIVLTDKSDFDNSVPEKFRDLWSQIKSSSSEVGCKTRMMVDSKNAIQEAVIMTDPHAANTTITQCVRRGLGEALGFIGELSVGVHSSMFSHDAKTNEFTLYDLGALQVFYSDQLRAGMTYREAFEKFYHLGQSAAERVFPAEDLHWQNLPTSMMPDSKP